MSIEVENNHRSLFQATCYSYVKHRLDKLGIKINGTRPCDIQIKDDAVFFRMVKCALGFDRVALGETYVDGKWECEDLMAFFDIFLRATDIVFNPSAMIVSNTIEMLPMFIFNMHNKLQSKKDVSFHYDLGNDLFQAMLGRSMTYSCAYWEKHITLDPLIYKNKPDVPLNGNQLCDDLDDAQMNKMLLIARKLNLKPGMTVLDIGNGWGYLDKFLAINFNVHVTGVTISKEQYTYASTTDLEPSELEFLRVPGLKPQGTGKFVFKLQDYRDIKEKYDRIICVEMLEHVGFKNHSEFFNIVHRCLKDDGLFFLHVIGRSHEFLPAVDPWMHKYIFPGFMIPHHQKLIKQFRGKFIIEDLHNLGYCFYRTLVAWHENFKSNWPTLEKKYGPRFYRMWTFYLMLCGGLFKTRRLNLFHFVLSKDGYPGYVSYR